MKQFRAWPQLRGIFVVMLVAPLLASCKVALDHHLSERQSNAIVAVLLAHEIPASKRAEKHGQYSVMVDKDDFAQAYALQRANGLPRRSRASMEQIFSHNGLVASPTAERAKFVFAQEQQLDAAIASISGVIDAHVLIVPASSDPLLRNPAAPSASVLVNIVPGAVPTDLLPRIKMLVANAVRGLDYGHVTIVTMPDKNVRLEAVVAMRSVFGIWVARSDATLVRLLLGWGLAALFIIFGLIVFWGWQIRENVQVSGRRLLMSVRR